MMAWHTEISDGIATLWVDVPDAKVNTFSTAMMAAFEQRLDELERRDDLLAVVLRSAKPRTFIAGAEISELAAIRKIEEATAKAVRGQAVFARLAALPVPTIAVIHGACLGGGLECALACDFRLVVDDEKTQLGLPEVRLGIIPGWGGTQRLPRLIGLEQAAPMILTGKSVDAKKALRLGLADGILTAGLVEPQLRDFLARIADAGERGRLRSRRGKGSLGMRLLTATAPGRAFFLRQARARVLAETKGLYPAPLAAIEALRSVGAPLAEGLRQEVARFAPLAVDPVSRRLVQIFFNNEALKKIGAATVSPPIRRTAVLGAGVMGGGIAWLSAKAGGQVRLRDLRWEPITKALQTAKAQADALVKRRKLTEGDATNAMLRIGASTELVGLGKTDLVIEAVVEDLAVKRRVLAEIEDHVPADCILASNTSSLTIADMARDLQHPGRFAGLHFFNPVHRMPLVEVVAGPATDSTVVDRLCAHCRDLGKTPIVVGDCPGFLVNRLLLPFMNEAAWLLQEGADPVQVDRVLMDFGMPMGAFRLADEVGLDVGYKVAAILAEAYGERMQVAPILKTLAEDEGLLGRKGGAGFYRYGNTEGKGTSLPPANPRVQALLPEPTHHLDEATIRDRCLLIMVNEASRCLAEGIIADPDQLDMALILGTGFPPCRGGLLRWAAERGLPAVVERLRELARAAGPRFEPTDHLIERSTNGGLFHGHIHVSPAA